VIFIEKVGRRGETRAKDTGASSRGKDEAPRRREPVNAEKGRAVFCGKSGTTRKKRKIIH